MATLTIPAKNCPWYCEDAALTSTTKPLRYVKANMSESHNHEDIFKFSSLARLRSRPIRFEPGAVTYIFEDFRDRPLGRPYAFIQVPKNGSGFYNALSVALEGHFGAGGEIRRIICDEMFANKQRFEQMTSMPCVPYVTKQRRNNAWADHSDIVFACSAFGVKILVFNDSTACWKAFAPESWDELTPTIYLLFIDLHYWLIVDGT